MNTEIAKPFLPSPSPVPANERGIAEQVGEEILHQKFRPAAWAKALAAARNRNTEATGEYARIRIAELARERRRCRAKAESLEIRRLRTGGGGTSVKELLSQGGRSPNQPNFDRPALSIVCLLSLLLGSAGSIGCGIRLFAGPSATAWTPLVSLLCALAIVGVVFLLWSVLPKHWLRMGYHLGLGSLTMLACLLSFALGARLLANSPQHWRLVNHRIVPVSCEVRGPADSGQGDRSVAAASADQAGGPAGIR